MPRSDKPHRPAAGRNVPIGPFTIDGSGLLRPATAASFPAFRVTWRRRTVHTRLIQASAETASGHLEFTGRLGRVPSTATPASTPAQRAAALGMMRTLPGLAPAGWNMALSPDHSVVVATTTQVALPISAVSLVSKVTQFLLTLAPYLDVLDAEGMTFEGAGNVST